MSLLLNPGAWLPVLLFSAVGSAGNLAEYYLGRGGSGVLTSGTSKITPERWQQIEGLYQKFGAPLLLLSAVPGLGLPLTTGAGAVGIGRAEFVVWVFIGKLVRNWLLVLIVFLGIDLAGFLNSKVLGREPLPDETVPDSPEPGFFSQWLLSKPPRPK